MHSHVLVKHVRKRVNITGESLRQTEAGDTLAAKISATRWCVVNVQKYPETSRNIQKHPETSRNIQKHPKHPTVFCSVLHGKRILGYFTMEFIEKSMRFQLNIIWKMGKCVEGAQNSESAFKKMETLLGG